MTLHSCEFFKSSFWYYARLRFCQNAPWPSQDPGENTVLEGLFWVFWYSTKINKYNLHQFINTGHQCSSQTCLIVDIYQYTGQTVPKGNQLPTLTSSITWTSTSMLRVSLSHLDLSICMYH